MFGSSGENVHLSCNNALSGCTSTTWMYNTHSETVELINLGIKKNNIERYERPSLEESHKKRLWTLLLQTICESTTRNLCSCLSACSS